MPRLSERQLAKAFKVAIIKSDISFPDPKSRAKLKKELGLSLMEINGQLSDTIGRMITAFMFEHRSEKNWDTCPYKYHSNDCDCNGEGGDR